MGHEGVAVSADAKVSMYSIQQGTAYRPANLASTTYTTDPMYANTDYQKYLPILPREQWETNLGYCGEVALISAGLHYGQYLSQYDARDLATGDQLTELDFSNAGRAAAGMLLTSESWTGVLTTASRNFSRG